MNSLLRLAHDCFNSTLRVLLELQHGHAAGADRGAARLQTGELEPVLDQRYRAVKRGDH
ncbi:hypothetical protein D3C86_2188090 [compost metagenome]